MAISSSNKLDFVPAAAEDGQTLPSFDLRTLGAAFAQPGRKGAKTKASLSGRCNFVLRQGFDPVDATSTGRVLEGSGDAGVSLRSGSTVLSVSSSGLTYRSGLDNPLAAAGPSDSAPGLRVTLGKEVSETTLAAVSFDLTQRKPEFSVAWSGSTFREQAAVVAHADPLLRTYKLSAITAFAGPEWRQPVLDRTRGVIEEPQDDGARHRLWVQHTVKDRQWGYRTRVGAAFDLGRVLNYAGDVFDTKVEPRIPPLLWRIPLLHRMYTMLVPEQDADQLRYRLKGWDLEGAYDFGQPGAQLGLAKHFSSASVRGTWHTGSQQAALTYSRSGVSVSARVARQGGGAGWTSPSLVLHVEPLGLL